MCSRNLKRRGNVKIVCSCFEGRSLLNCRKSTTSITHFPRTVFDQTAILKWIFFSFPFAFLIISAFVDFYLNPMGFNYMMKQNPKKKKKLISTNPRLQFLKTQNRTGVINREEKKRTLTSGKKRKNAILFASLSPSSFLSQYR